MSALIAAEWVKLRSVRSTLLGFGVAALAGVLTIWLVANAVGTWDGWSPERRAEARAADGSLPWIGDTTFTLAYLAIAISGTVAVTSEYATGTIRTSLSGTPRRLRWMFAKCATVAVASLLTGLAVMVPSVLAAHAIVGDRQIGPPYVIGNGLSDALVWVSAGGLVAMVTGLVGLGIGLALRSTALAVTVSAGLLVVPGVIVVTLPVSIAEKFTSVLLPNLAAQLAGSPHAIGSLSSPEAGVVLVCYLVVALGAGALVLGRRDAG